MLLLAAALAAAYVPTGSFDYPDAARRRGEQGITTVGFEVDALGRPRACRVVRSSGSASLDAASCPLLLKRAVFAPPAGPTMLTKRIRWQLVGDPPEDDRVRASDRRNASVAGWLLLAAGGGYIGYGAVRARRPGLGQSGDTVAIAAATRDRREAGILIALLGTVLGVIAMLVR